MHNIYSADSEICMRKAMTYRRNHSSGSKDRLVTSLECILYVSQQLTVYNDSSRMANLWRSTFIDAINLFF